MSGTSVPNSAATGSSVAGILDRLAAEMEGMSPQLRKAAAHVLDHPDDVGWSSVRELAEAAAVKPNTLVRLARAIGFSGFEEFRDGFRDEIRVLDNPMSVRAEWLQQLSAGDDLDVLFAEVAGAALVNIERMYATTPVEEMRIVAGRIVDSRRTYVIGVGANFALAQNFAYLAGMATEQQVISVPRQGNVPMDAIVRAGPGDVVIAMTFAPYRSEVVEATAAARDQGATVVAITDSHGSPISLGADHVVIAPSETPGFFPSTLAAAAALEMLATFIVAGADRDVVTAIDRFHRRRYDLGVYWKE